MTEQVTCPQCGLQYRRDEDRRCWMCDGRACPHCMSILDGPLCPECTFGSLPAHIEPMLAVQGEMPSKPKEWAFEYKWDGVRVLSYWHAGQLRLESRNLIDITARYPELLPTPDQMPAEPVILDGEIVALDSKGSPSFARLQRRMHASPAAAERLVRSVPTNIFIFDILWHGSTPLVEKTYQERRKILEGLRLAHPAWRVPASHSAEGPAMLRVARKWKLEGLMAKKLDSVYRPGERTHDWTKIKIVHRQEFVVGGWEPREADSGRISALLVGYYSERHPGLVFAGRVGTGFSDKTHQRLLSMMEKQKRAKSPFSERLNLKRARYVTPTLVAEVDYRRWPPGGQLQQASFMGLRNDIAPQDIVVERGK